MSVIDAVAKVIIAMAIVPQECNRCCGKSYYSNSCCSNYDLRLKSNYIIRASHRRMSDSGEEQLSEKSVRRQLSSEFE